MRGISPQYTFMEQLGAVVSLVKNNPVDRLEILKGSALDHDLEDYGTRLDDTVMTSTIIHTADTRDSIRWEIERSKELDPIMTRDNMRIFPAIIDRLYIENTLASFFSMEIPAIPNRAVDTQEDFRGRIQTLDALLKKKQFAAEELLRFSGEMAHRYQQAYAHAGCIINDIKPANILLVLRRAEEYSLQYPFVLDRGASYTATAPPRDITHRLFGTLAYMAPEELQLYAAMYSPEKPIIGLPQQKTLEERLALPKGMLMHMIDDIHARVSAFQDKPDHWQKPQSASDVFSFGVTVAAAQHGHPYLPTYRDLRVYFDDVWAIMIAQDLFFKNHPAGIFPKHWRYPFLSATLAKTIAPDPKARPRFKQLERAYFADEKFQRLVNSSKYAAAVIGLFAAGLLAYNQVTYLNSAAYTKNAIITKYEQQKTIDAKDVSTLLYRLAREKVHFVTAYPQNAFIQSVTTGGKNSFSLSTTGNTYAMDAYAIAYHTQLLKLTGDSSLLSRIDADILLLNTSSSDTTRANPFRIIYAHQVIEKSNLSSHINTIQYTRLVQIIPKLVAALANEYTGTSLQGFYCFSNTTNRITGATKSFVGHIFQPYSSFVVESLLLQPQFDTIRMQNHFKFFEKNALFADGGTRDWVYSDSSFEHTAYYNANSSPKFNRGLQDTLSLYSTNMFTHTLMTSAVLMYAKTDTRLKTVAKRMIDFSLNVFTYTQQIPEEIGIRKNADNPEKSAFVTTHNDGSSIRENNLALLVLLDNLNEAKSQGINIPNKIYDSVVISAIQRLNTDGNYPGLMPHAYIFINDVSNTSWYCSNYFALKMLEKYKKNTKND